MLSARVRPREPSFCSDYLGVNAPCRVPVFELAAFAVPRLDALDRQGAQRLDVYTRDVDSAPVLPRDRSQGSRERKGEPLPRPLVSRHPLVKGEKKPEGCANYRHG